MGSRDYVASSSRSRHPDNRHLHFPHPLNNKKSVENYISTSTLASTPPININTGNLQKPKAFSASSQSNPYISPKERQPIKETFLWAKGELIGQGSHGRVYLGFNATTGELMAVKQVEVPRTANDRRKAEIEDFVKTLRSEKETLKELDHPNIVEYLGFEENPQTVNIFLQYVSGGTISRCLKEYGAFKEEVTKDFARQILEGVAYLHSKGIIHRDLKSDNILIESTGVCKISDFGISKKLHLDRAYSAFKGTSYWMSPEMVLAGNEGYTSKVDIWSVGCIVFEMWTAKRPWFDHNIFQVIEKLTEKQAPPIPPDFSLCILGNHFRLECFNPEPADRPSAETLLIHPYLIIPKGWIFPGMDDMSKKSAVSESPISEMEAITQSFSQTITLESSRSSSRPPSPAITMNSVVTVPKRPMSPIRPTSPLVTPTTPPPPRKLPKPLSPREDESTFATAAKPIESKAQGSRQPQRKLDIHDPSKIPDFSKPKRRVLPTPPTPQPFFYKPPELPSISDTPYSNSLTPVPKFIPPPPSRKGHHEKQKSSVTFFDQPSASTLSLPTQMPHRMGPANLQDAMSYTESSRTASSADDYSMYTMSSSYSGWKIPPPHSAPPPVQRRPSLPPIPNSNSNSATNARATQRQSLVFSGVKRPDNRQVLEHMKVFFPDHDLDEPLVSSPTRPGFEKGEVDNSNVILSRHFTMKSINSIAEEQIYRTVSSPSRKRQTRLWGSNIEEIKGNR